jgi:hypothetical protein
LSFAGAENSNGRPPRDRNVAVCSQKRALLVTATVLGVLLAVALLIAYAGPQDCPCAGKMPKGYVLDGYNSSEKFEPYATNGQLFPWLLPFLPSNIRPNRYTILIHPNLTTFEVKGERDSLSVVLFIHVNDIPALQPAFFSSSSTHSTTLPCRFLVTFIGQVSIEFYVEKEMSFIVLHAQNLNITEKVSP